MEQLLFEILAFDVSAISKAKRRARASEDDLTQVVGSLKEVLDDFGKRLRERKP